MSDDDRELEERAHQHVLALLEEHAILEYIEETLPIVAAPQDVMERRPQGAPPSRQDWAVFALGRSLKKR